MKSLRLNVDEYNGRDWLVDVAYAGQDTLHALPANCDLTARWQTNVRLCAPAPTRRPRGHRGPLAKRGAALPTPRQMLEQRCRQIELDLYGRHQTLRVNSCVACLYTVPQRSLAMVAVEPLNAAGRPMPDHRAFYFSTAQDAAPEQVLAWYALRWTVEVAIRDSKQQVGFGQPQGWTEQAVRRTAPTLMLMYSIVTLWFRQEGHRHYRQLHWPWYPHKAAVSFADMLVTLRQGMIRQHLKEILKPACANGVSRKPLRLLIRLARLAA